MSSDFHFFVPESFYKNLVHIGKAVSEKIRFEFLYVQDLGPRASNDLDLQYSHTFIYSIRRGVPLDLSTPTGMSCIGTYEENFKSDNVSNYRVLLVAFLLLWPEN